MSYDLKTQYFEWMYRMVCNRDYLANLSFRKLISFLHQTDFSYSLPMDANRADDGVELRYRFGQENGIAEPVVSSELDDRPCSVLEMMIALSLRCEEHIMDDQDVGNRTGQWFWTMITNLGLGHMDDANFNRNYVEDQVYGMLDRQYDRYGKGSLFPLEKPRRDMRRTEIWYQAMWYLTENYYERR